MTGCRACFMYRSTWGTWQSGYIQGDCSHGWHKPGRCLSHHCGIKACRASYFDGGASGGWSLARAIHGINVRDV